jgi:hypothetical protein
MEQESVLGTAICQSAMASIRSAMLTYLAWVSLQSFHACYRAARYARGQGNFGIFAVEPGFLFWLKAVGMRGVNVFKRGKNGGMVLRTVSHDLSTLRTE